MAEIPRVQPVDPLPRVAGQVHRISDAGDRKGHRGESERERRDDTLELAEKTVEPDETRAPDQSPSLSSEEGLDIRA